ncbi:hypothetical protein V2J09_001077 [Rumex salicifolius]
MAYCTSGWVNFMLLLHVSLLMLPSPVLSRDDDLLNGLNNYRGTHNLPDLSETPGASCLAQGIATQFQDSQACFSLPTMGSYSISAGSDNPIRGYYRLLGDCNLDIENTKDGVIMPACIGDVNADITYVVSNFTETGYTQYLRNADYTGVGIGSEGNWVVVILGTDEDGGSFSSGDRRMVFGVGGWVVVLFGVAQFLICV